MLLLLIFGIGLATGIVLYIIGTRREWTCDLDDIGVAFNFIFGVILGACFIAIAIIHISAPEKVEKDKVRYEMLTYQWENDIYDNDNDLGKRDLVEQIREWNEDLAAGKRMQHDIWVGAFVPDIYDQFEFIPLERSEKQ